MEPDETDFAERDEEFDRDLSSADGGRDLAVDLNQDSDLDDDVDIGIAVIGSRPVVVESDTEIDQQGELDQHADVYAEAGESGGHDMGVETEQRPEVDQRIDVDVEVSEEDGVIVVEVDAEVEDDL